MMEWRLRKVKWEMTKPPTTVRKYALLICIGVDANYYSHVVVKFSRTL